MYIENDYDREYTLRERIRTLESELREAKKDFEDRIERALLINEQRLDENADLNAKLALYEQQYRENLSHALIQAVVTEDNLERKLEQVESDAARYRWLKKGGKPAVGYLEMVDNSADWDQIIDNAMGDTK